MHGFAGFRTVLVLFELIGTETQILGLVVELGLHSGGGILILLVEYRRLLREFLGRLLVPSRIGLDQRFILRDGCESEFFLRNHSSSH